MNTTGYSNQKISGMVPIEKIIEPQYKAQAKQYAEYLNSITLTGNKSRTNRTPEDMQKDAEAIDILHRLQECNDPALAYGFMLYDEAHIVKIYWAKRCGKLRQNKAEFFNQDVYLQWLTQIFATLNGDHEKFHDPLYFYKLNSTATRSGKKVGDYDVMNSFRTHWNMYFLPILAQYLFKLDQLEFEGGAVSIEASLENEDGGHHLDAELAKNAKTVWSVEQQDTFDEVEAFLKTFLKAPLNQPIPVKAGSRSAGVTYTDVMKAIVHASVSSAAGLRSELGLSMSILNRTTEQIYRLIEKRGLTIQDFADYLSSYSTVAIDILDGKPNSFRMVE